MSKGKTRATEFSCHATGASTVFLAGTFNDWQTDATPLTKNDDGDWKANLHVPPGRHEFKFVVDGQWCCEPGCQGAIDCSKCVPNEFGTMNRIVDVA